MSCVFAKHAHNLFISCSSCFKNLFNSPGIFHCVRGGQWKFRDFEEIGRKKLGPTAPCQKQPFSSSFGVSFAHVSASSRLYRVLIKSQWRILNAGHRFTWGGAGAIFDWSPVFLSPWRRHPGQPLGGFWGLLAALAWGMFPVLGRNRSPDETSPPWNSPTDTNIIGPSAIGFGPSFSISGQVPKNLPGTHQKLANRSNQFVDHFACIRP